MVKKVFTILIIPLFFMSYIVECAEGSPMVRGIKGQVTLIPGGTKTGYSAENEMQVMPGDWLVTSAGANAEIVFDPEGVNSVLMDENSIVVLKDRVFYDMEYIKGTLSIETGGYDTGKLFGVKTSDRICRTGAADWYITSAKGTTYVVVKKNEIIINDLYADGTLGDLVTINSGNLGVLNDDSVKVAQSSELRRVTSNGIVEIGGVGINQAMANTLENVFNSER